MRESLLGLLLIAWFSIFGQYNTTVYIDPDYTGTETGTITQPFNSWSDFNFSSNTAYLQKRGTIAQGGMVVTSKNYLLIGAYGSGNDPVITGIPGQETSIISFFKSNHCVVENLTITGHHPSAPTAGVYITGNWIGNITSSDITVKNCDISYCYNGVRVLPGTSDVDKVTVENCEIHHINEDGIFAIDLNNFTCRNSHIYFVNLDWHYHGHTVADAPGDGIQLGNDCDNFLIEGCIIDRRYTGLKFCFIHNGNNMGFENDGIIRDCAFYPPKDTIGGPSAGGAIYLYDGDSILIERTKIIGTDRIYSNDAGVGGQLSFDHIIMNYVLGDSVHNFKVGLFNEFCELNNVTFTSNRPNVTMLDLSGGLTNITNSAFACGPNTAPTYGIITQSNNLVYIGDDSNWGSTFGWADWANGDYHLLETSPLIDAGSDVGQALDLDNLPVPFGIAPDIGCYEYSSSSGLAPIPDFNVLDTVINMGESVHFFDASLNNPTSWLWVFDEGNPAFSYDQNPTINYNSSGMHDVTLVAINSSGYNVKSKKNYIHVLQPALAPITDFSTMDTLVHPGDLVSFIDNSLNNPTMWIWLFEGGNPQMSNLQNPIISYDSSGVYNVMLIAKNAIGQDIEIKTSYIEVYESFSPPHANFAPSDSVLAIGETILFTDKSGNTPTSWNWFFEAGSPSVSNLENPQVTYNSMGEFNVILVVKNAFGNDIEIKSKYIRVYNPNLAPVANFSANKTYINPGDSVSFTDESLNVPTTWTWVFEGVTPNIVNTQNPTVKYTNPGNYNVMLIAANPGGTSSKIKTDVIHVSNSEENTFFPFYNQITVHELDTVMFTDPDKSSSYFGMWILEGGFPVSSVLKVPRVIYKNEGNYKLKLLLSDGDNLGILTKETSVIVLPKK
ncbi:MAG: PKD domain-containing protein [Bacteroidales bacterium]|nr:PKD domain-containing protein [Bacteroidales bacterium]